MGYISRSKGSISTTERIRWNANVAVNVKYPIINGVEYSPVLTDGSDTTTALQTIINAVADAGGGVIYFPVGTFYFTSIYMRENVTLEGASLRGTILKALASSSKGLITANYPQPIHRACIRRMTLDGGWTNDGQWGLYMNATQQVDVPHTGGVWYSRFELIHINGFKGGCIYSRAINIDGDVANQFLTFKDVTGYRWQDQSSVGLKMIGQLGQACFENCEFSTSAGGQKIAGSNVVLGIDDTGQQGITADEADQAPMQVKFINCTFQNSVEAFNIRRGANIAIDTCWFENVGKSVTVWGSARQILVQNCHFANACSDGSGGGYGVYSTGNSTVSALNNYFFGAIDVPIKESNGYGMLQLGNRCDGYAGSMTSGYNIQMSLSGNSIDTNWHRDILLNATNGTLNTINTKLGSGESVTIRAWNFGSYIKIDRTGNIDIRNPLYLKHGEAATFGINDLGDATRRLHLISTTQRELQTSSLDTDANGQFFYLGEYVHNLSPLGTGYAAWKCTKQGKYHHSNSKAVTTSGSNQITINDAATYKWVNGDAISGAGIPAGTTIIGLSGNVATLSNNCTAGDGVGQVFIYDAQFVQYGRLSNTLTLSATETAFSAAGYNQVNCNQSATSTITSITGGTEGYDIRLYGMNGNTTVAHNASIRLKSGANITIPVDGMLTLVFTNGKWIET